MNEFHQTITQINHTTNIVTYIYYHFKFSVLHLRTSGQRFRYSFTLRENSLVELELLNELNYCT